MQSIPVSVVMAVYNAGKYIKESIESILSQTFGDFEFIIINDGSTDNSAEIIKSFKDERIIYIFQQNKGLAPSLNKAISLANGRYIVRLDADDIALPGRIEMQFKFLEENKNRVLAGSNAQIIDMNGEYLYTSNIPIENSKILESLVYTSPFYHSSVIYRKEVFNLCGGYCEKTRHHIEDFILWNRMKEYGELCNMPEPLIKYRLTPGAITNRDKKSAAYMINIAKKIVKEGDASEKELLDLKKMTNRKSEKQKLSSYFSNIGCINLYRLNNRKNALISFIKAFYYSPIHLSHLFFITLSLMPGFFTKMWLKFRKISFTGQ